MVNVTAGLPETILRKLGSKNTFQTHCYYAKGNKQQKVTNFLLHDNKTLT